MHKDLIKLGEAATYINGYAFKPDDRGKVGLPIIRIQDLTGNSYDLGFYDGDYPEKIEINDGDVLISWSASLGVYIWNNGKALLNQHIFKVVFDKVNIDKNYFVYAVRYKLDEMGRKTHGATMKHIVKRDFDATEIPYPSKHEQIEIANNLKRIENIIELRSHELQLLDELIKARFVEMFGDAVENPMGWKKRQLQEIVTDDCTISYGIVQTGDDQEEGVPVFRPVDIVNRVPKLDDLKKTTEKISNKYKRTILKGREMLITVRANIADTYIIGEEFKGCNVGRGIVPIRTQENIIVLEFLKYLMDSKHLNDDIKSKAKGITLIQLNMEDLRAVELIVPPLEQQKAFVEFAKQVDKSKLLSLIKLLEQLITYLYNVFIIYRQDKGEEVENHG